MWPPISINTLELKTSNKKVFSCIIYLVFYCETKSVKIKLIYGSFWFLQFWLILDDIFILYEIIDIFRFCPIFCGNKNYKIFNIVSINFSTLFHCCSVNFSKILSSFEGNTQFPRVFDESIWIWRKCNSMFDELQKFNKKKICSLKILTLIVNNSWMVSQHSTKWELTRIESNQNNSKNYFIA